VVADGEAGVGWPPPECACGALPQPVATASVSAAPAISRAQVTDMTILRP